MRLTAEVIRSARIFLNPLQEREIDLRGLKIPALENLGALLDQVDVVDLTDNEIEVLENFPKLKRLKWLLLSNNRVSRLREGIEEAIPDLRVLVLANNRVNLMSEIDKIAKFTHLEVLNLMDNPVRNQKHYRLYVIHKIPSLVILDHDRVRAKEREEAAEMFGTASGQAFMSKVQQQGEAMKQEVASEGVALTAEQKQVLAVVLAQATTQAEIERLERMLKAGIVPDENTLRMIQEGLQPGKSSNSSKSNVGQDNTTTTNIGNPAQGTEAMEVDSAATLTRKSAAKPPQEKPQQVEETQEQYEARIDNFTVKDLKAELHRYDLDTTGKKSVLKDRLLEYVRSRDGKADEEGN